MERRKAENWRKARLGKESKLGSNPWGRVRRYLGGPMADEGASLCPDKADERADVDLEIFTWLIHEMVRQGIEYDCVELRLVYGLPYNLNTLEKNDITRHYEHTNLMHLGIYRIAEKYDIPKLEEAAIKELGRSLKEPDTIEKRTFIHTVITRTVKGLSLARFRLYPHGPTLNIYFSEQALTRLCTDAAVFEERRHTQDLQSPRGSPNSCPVG
jgi:hypothetical protein